MLAEGVSATFRERRLILDPQFCGPRSSRATATQVGI